MKWQTMASNIRTTCLTTYLHSKGLKMEKIKGILSLLELSRGLGPTLACPSPHLLCGGFADQCGPGPL